MPRLLLILLLSITSASCCAPHSPKPSPPTKPTEPVKPTEPEKPKECEPLGECTQTDIDNCGCSSGNKFGKADITATGATCTSAPELMYLDNTGEIAWSHDGIACMNGEWIVDGTINLKSTKVRSITMQSLIFIVIIAIGMVMSHGHDRFDPNLHHCGPYGVLKEYRVLAWTGKKCECFRNFHGNKCEIYHSRRCTRHEDCGTNYAYCARKLAIQYRLSPFGQDPSGWCQPLDPALL